MLTLQLWSPDTCRCSVHQGVTEEQDVPEGGTKDIVYLTHKEAVDLHTDRFIRRPANTVCWPFFRLFRYVSPTIRQRLRPLFHNMAHRLQARSRQCLYHEHMGETHDLYDTVHEENTRKNICQHLAWRIANDISNEDMAWLHSSPNQRIRESRQKVLEKVVPLMEIEWGFDRDGPVNQNGSVSWKHPAVLGLHFPAHAQVPWQKVDAVQAACNSRFPQGLVVVD